MNKKSFCIISILILISLSTLNADDKTLSFQEAGSLAIEYSADLKYSRASQVLMEKAWKWGLRRYFPQLSITASENDRLQKQGADSFIKNYSINLDQLVFDGGRTRLSRNLEKAELNLSSSRLDRMASDISESAITAYRNILSSRTILEIRMEALIVLEEQLRILGEEVNLGLSLPIDFANAEINLRDAELNIQSLKIDLEELEKQFTEMLGLETLPELTEKIDVNRSLLLPSAVATAALAREKNPDLVEARFSITRRKAELKYVSGLWIPTVRFTGSFGLSGQQYPLTRHNWSLGVSIEFAGPWIQNRIGFQAGWEMPHDKTAALQNSLSPLPDPASGTGKKQAKLALELEQDNYKITLERIGRMAANAIEKCAFAEERRILALQAVDLGRDRCRVEEVRLGLGHITRLNLMETYIEQTQREINAVQAATALLEAERELERFLDLKPGELETIVTEKLIFNGINVEPSALHSNISFAIQRPNLGDKNEK